MFVRVVDAGSITAAAETFDLTPTMVGNYLQGLEQHLGAKLLHRTTRRQSVTDFGRIYYARCIEILGLVEDSETLPFETHSVCKGLLRVTAPTIWTNILLVPILKYYFRQHPEVDLDVIATDKILDLAEERVEAAIRFGPASVPTLATRPLEPYRRVYCAAPSYLAEHGTPTAPEDLSSHQVIDFAYPATSEGLSRDAIWRFDEAGGPTAFR